MRVISNTNLLKSGFCAAVIAVVALLAPVGVATAAEEKERKYDDVKTKQRHAVGAKCGKKLEEVQKIIEEEENFKEAVQVLSGAIDSSCKTSYEKSQTYNFMGYAYYSLEQYSGAIKSYSKAIAEPEVDERMKVNLRYTLAQLYMVTEDFANAAKQLEAWLKETTLVTNDGKVLLAQVYYQLDKKSQSLKLINEVVTDVESKGELPKENWWGLQKALYYENEDYKTVVAILQKLIRNYNKLSYWKQLGGMYNELDMSAKELITTDVVYLMGGLEKDRQQLALAYMYLGADAPYNAARIIEKGMAAGVIEQNFKNLELLGTAWQAAEERKKAMPVLEKAAALSDNGEIWARLASVYVDSAMDDKAVKAARNALRKGGLKRTDLTYLTLGSAQINLHCYDDAQESFNKASKDDRSKKVAAQWTNYAKNEGSRRSALIKSGAKIATCQNV